jgi:hypothetical protein
MTTKQIANLFRARKVGRGKWMAHCPIHGRDRSPSLEIKEGRNPGTTIVGCYAGCSKDAVLSSVGLTLRDLFADAMPDKEALALAGRMRAQEAREAKRRRQKERREIDRGRKWEACRDSLGLLLMQRPEDDKLASLFHWSCEQTRNIPSTGQTEPQPNWSGLFPTHHPLAEITAQDVGRQIGSYLRLPNE